MNVKRSLGEKVFAVFNGLVMTFLMIICLYPVLYVVFASLSEPLKLFQHEGLLLRPMGFTLKGYELVLKDPRIVTGYTNTLIYVVAGTTINLFLTSLGAYVLSRKNVLLNNFFMFIAVFTMFFSGGLIPLYLQVQGLGLMNNRMAMILPRAVSTYNLIIMRTSFMGIPDSLEESAKIDGANHFTILFRIILPLSKAVIAVMVLFYGVTYWNSWFSAVLYLRDRSKFPLQIVLREILLMNATDNMTIDSSIGQGDISAYKYLIQYATIVVATLPILTLYPFIQKHFTKGVMVGAVKG